ncbi:MAG: response regulator [Desulfobacteraceae bacterium]|nr:MAG: response regulator [Desulfobacteraceae bacterium]
MVKNGLKILAIDDSSINLMILESVIKDAFPEATLFTASTGINGIELAQINDPDVILLDIVMPGMDGFEVCRKLKQDQRLLDIPVIFLTALKTDRESRIRALDAGCEAFLSRPIDEIEFTAQIRAMNRIRAARRLERKRAEDALLESEKKYRFIVENSNDIIWTFDLSTMTFNFCSNAVEQILGYSEDEVELRNTLDDIFPIETKRNVMAEFGKLLDGNATSNRVLMEAQHCHRDGFLVWLEINAVLQKDDFGRPAFFSGVSRDITGRKQADAERLRLEAQLRQAQKMESIGLLAGGVAHDFNNMLGVIIGHAELVMEQVDPGEEAYNDLEEILKAANRSANLTHQLLAFARKQAINPVILDLNDAISGMLKMLRRLIGEDIRLVWKPGSELWAVKIDPAQVDQIMANLLVNARDAIPGVGDVSIETDNVVINEADCLGHAGFVPGEYVLISVSDSGSGIDKETVEHIFEPFYTTKEMGKGTGLGLATVYGIVKQNNGFIYVYSEPGKGSSFKIYLPMMEKIIEIEKEETPRKLLEGLETVLLVEDEGAILKIGRSILERYGYTVISASTPGAALTLAGEFKGPVHLLITDVVMPEMNGKEMWEKISHLHPETKCLFMSGYTADAIAHHGVLDEGVNFLQKPFSVKVLAEKVRKTLDG